MYLQYKKHQVHYTKFGDGDRLLIIFHGFGDQSDLFLNLEQGLKDRYTVVAVDSPFHGQTEWNKPVFVPKDLRRIVQQIREQLGFERFSLMAHSMGGLLVMGIFKHFAKYVDELILLAPAGLKRSVIYNKLLFSLPLRQFFKWTISKPKVGNQLLNVSRKWGWLDRISYRFFAQQLNSPEKRRRLFNTWLSLYFFPRRLPRFRRLIRKYSVELLIFYGRKDKLTPAASGERFAKKLQKPKRKNIPQVEIQLVNDGHFFIREPLNAALAQRFGRGV